MYVLDLNTFHFSNLRTTNLPAPREGHSLMGYSHYLLLFGGCESGEDDAKPFSELSVLDLNTKNWQCPKVLGKKPEGREGHAVGIIKHFMVIYGGNGCGRIFEDIFALNLKNFEWKELRQEGDLPGPRESMGSTVAAGKLYVFGGNVNEPNEEMDEYTSELYQISMQSDLAVCKKLETDGPEPPKRLSHSMTSFKNKYLLMFGGESFGQAMDDIWVYNLERNCWREIHPNNSIIGLMANVCCTYKNSLIVFGGMGSDKLAKSDLAVLSFGEPKIDISNGSGKQVKRKMKELMLVSPQNQGSVNSGHSEAAHTFMCERCGHNASICSFLEAYPEICYPKMNFFARSQIPTSILDKMSQEFQDPLAALLRSCLIIGKSVNIVITGTVKLRNELVVKNMPDSVRVDFSFMGECDSENQEGFYQRQNYFRKWKPEDLETEASVLKLMFEETALNPQEVAHLSSGTHSKNLLAPLFAISGTALIISRDQQFLTVSLVQKKETHSPCYYVVFDKNNTPVFPSKELFHPNLSHILSLSHLSSSSAFFAHKYGTTIFLYSPEFTQTQTEINYQQIPVSCLLAQTFLSSPQMQFSVNSTPVSHFSYSRLKKQNKFSSPLYKIDSCEDLGILTLAIFYKRKLVHWEYSSSQLRRRRDSEAMIVKIKDKSLINPVTKMLLWGKETMFLFKDIYKEGDKKRKLAE